MRGWRERENDEPRNTQRGEERRFHLFRKTRSLNRRGKKGRTDTSKLSSATNLQLPENNVKPNGPRVRGRNGRSSKGEKKEEEGGC